MPMIPRRVRRVSQYVKAPPKRVRVNYDALLAEAIAKANEIACDPPLLYASPMDQASCIYAQFSDPGLAAWMEERGMEVKIVKNMFNTSIEVGVRKCQ